MCLVTWSPLDLNVAQLSSMYVEVGGVNDGNRNEWTPTLPSYGSPAASLWSASGL